MNDLIQLTIADKVLAQIRRIESEALRAKDEALLACKANKRHWFEIAEALGNKEVSRQYINILVVHAKKRKVKYNAWHLR